MKNHWSQEINKIDEIIIEKMKEWKVPGLSVAIIKDGGVIHSKGFGHRNIEDKLDVTTKTLFGTASTGKSFTAMCIGILVQQGKLNLDTPIKHYIPGFKLYDPIATEKLTARDILCHRSGVARHELMWLETDISRKELVERMQYLPPTREFREAWQYSNQMYAVAGYLIEVISGITYQEFVKKYIFTPLGMKDCNFSIDETTSSPDYALPYKENAGAVVKTKFTTSEAIVPAGSINANIEDIAKWILFQLNKGALEGEALLSPGIVESMHTPQIPYVFPYQYEGVHNVGYGMGWMIDIYRGEKMLIHGGYDEGFTALYSFIPNQNIGVAILTNMDHTLLTYALSYEIYDRLLGLSERDWSKECKKYTEGNEEMIEQMIAAFTPPKKEGTKPCHALTSYAGKFENPAYGFLLIDAEENALRLRFNGINCILQHHHFETFIFTHEFIGLPFTVTFYTDNKGEVNSLSIPFAMDPSINEIEFKRV